MSEVRGAPEGARNHTLNRAAFNLAQLVAGDELNDTDVRDALQRAGEEAGLSETETRRTIESGFAAGLQEPRNAPEPTHQQRGHDGRAASPAVCTPEGVG